ncbi:MAG: hypothetical protein P8184_14575 [Calditrichia bacterium]
MTVGHGSVIHGATIGDNCIIAIKSAVLNHAVVGDFSIIGAGAIVMERKEIPSHSIAFGIPAKVVKVVTEEIEKDIQLNAQVYVELGKAYLKRKKNL